VPTRLEDYRPLSLWWDGLDEVGPLRPSLGGDLDVDVAIVGGGFTGLWTARELLERDPTLRVVVLEAETCGFGASGRNGGWASALFATSDAMLTATAGPNAALAMRRAMQEAVDELGRSAAADGIDCDFTKGGSVTLCRSAPQVARAQAELAEAKRLGLGPSDLTWLEQRAALERCSASSVLGATYTPHCAALQPAKLVRGLARSVEGRGAQVFEATPVRSITPGRPGRRAQAVTDHGVVTADVVVRATEAWTATFAASHRQIAPLYSLMVATPPLDDATWAAIGLAERETFADYRHLVIYGQRTADGRLAFGGRGAPYHLRSRIEPRFDRNVKVARLLRETVVELFPILEGVDLPYHWGGPLGVPRDWASAVGFDRATGEAWAGGYVGDGVTTSNLAGRTLADLICGHDTELTRLAWVGHRSPDWEPEPLRWLGVNAGLLAAQIGDASEHRRGRRSRLASALQGYLDRPSLIP